MKKINAEIDAVLNLSLWYESELLVRHQNDFAFVPEHGIFINKIYILSAVVLDKKSFASVLSHINNFYRNTSCTCHHYIQ